MGACVCECVFKRVNVLGVLESVASRAVKRCPAPATSVTRDPCDSCFVLGSPGPSDIPPLELPLR